MIPFQTMIRTICCMAAFLFSISCGSEESVQRNDEEYTDTVTQLQRQWYMLNQSQSYTSEASQLIRFQIENALQRLVLFPANSVMTLRGNSGFTLLSYIDESVYTDGYYSANSKTITFNFQHGSILSNSITGIYTMIDSNLVVTFDKPEIIGYMKYEPENADLVNQNTDSLAFTYTFTRIPYASADITDGTYSGTAIFTSPEINPIKNYKITVKSLSQNSLTLTFDPFTYRDTVFRFENVSLTSTQTTNGLSFSTSNNTINSGDMKVSLSFSGTIINKILSIPKMTIRTTVAPELGFSFRSE